MSLEEYIQKREELEGLQIYCKLLLPKATEEALVLRLSSDREDAKVWMHKQSYASVAMIPTVVPTDEIVDLREFVKEQEALAKERNAKQIEELLSKIQWLSNTDEGRVAASELAELEQKHTELKPQLRVKFRY